MDVLSNMENKATRKATPAMLAYYQKNYNENRAEILDQQQTIRRFEPTVFMVPGAPWRSLGSTQS